MPPINTIHLVQAHRTESLQLLQNGRLALDSLRHNRITQPQLFQSGTQRVLELIQRLHVQRAEIIQLTKRSHHLISG